MRAKVLGFGIFVGLIGILLLFDYVHAGLFTVDLVSVTPSPVPADGVTPVTMKARVSRGGVPVSGHDLYIISLSGGNFSPYRATSDENGETAYTYYPYKVSSVNPLQDIKIRITDESNSVFLEVNAQGDFIIPAVDSGTEEELFTIDSFWN
jgi:hypothetical protein